MAFNSYFEDDIKESLFDAKVHIIKSAKQAVPSSAKGVMFEFLHVIKLQISPASKP